MLKDEKGMSNVELVIGVIVVIVIVGFSIFLCIGEKEPKNNEIENTITNEIENTANSVENTANEIGNTVTEPNNENNTDNNDNNNIDTNNTNENT